MKTKTNPRTSAASSLPRCASLFSQVLNLVYRAEFTAAVERTGAVNRTVFLALKQNLRIKTFVGTSANAVHIQIGSALISILRVKYLQFKSRCAWALSHLIALLRWNLFSYHDLWSWLDRPTKTPPWHPPENQLVLDSIIAPA